MSRASSCGGRRSQRRPRASSRLAGSRIAELAKGQHGVVTRRQCLAAGVSSDAIRGQLAGGLLHPVHRGVYRVGPVEAPLAREMAAVLACGVGAAVSHPSAGGLWRIRARAARDAPVHVTVAGGPRGGLGVRVHRVRARLAVDEVTVVEGIPVTTPARTLLDLASELRPRALEQAVAEALALRLTDPERLRALLARHAGRPGTPHLAAVLGVGGSPVLTRSEAEERFLALVLSAGLRRPECNARVAGFEVDGLWRAERVVVEIDGFAFHRSRAAFERDRRKAAALLAAGYVVLRFTWTQLVEEPEKVVASVAAALAVAGRR